MTAPRAIAPDQSAPDLIGIGAQSIIENAKRLGLTWTLSLATVIIASPNEIEGIVDGDTESIGMTSMIGFVSANQRVYVIQVPPSGNFIVGATTGVGIYRARRTLATTTAEVTFSNIPTTLWSLIIRYTARSDGAGGGIQATQLRVNGDSATNYGGEYTQGSGAGTSSALVAGGTSLFIGNHTNATASPATNFGSGEISIVGWDAPHAGTLGMHFQSQAFAAGGNHIVGGGNYFGAHPYTSLTFFPAVGSWVSGSDFQLEGIQG